eukprot:Tbor_TRINITY_DN6091_c0_g2::TRINITY_DN6091_c0_g2_i1::g.11192::m.11192
MRPRVLDFVTKHLYGLKISANVSQTSNPIIGTHNGTFHCDEAMACGLLRHTKDYSSAEIVRTRDPDLLAQCNIIVDVGGVYDPKTLRFDHHQNDFQDTMITSLNQYKTRLSSAGLVYRHFGKEIIEMYCNDCVESGVLDHPLTESELNVVYDRVYRNFMEHIDGIDNGVNEYSSADNDSSNIVRNYRGSTNLSSRVGSLNSRWNEANDDNTENNHFSRAVTLSVGEFFECVDFYLSSWMPARTLLEKGFLERAKNHPSSAIVVIEKGGCPWREHLFDIENEHNTRGQVLYVLFPDGKGGWRIQAVPKEPSGFENRKSLPWKGLRDEELDKASEVEGGVFVHASGFIGGNKTFDGAMKMAIKAVEM